MKLLSPFVLAGTLAVLFFPHSLSAVTLNWNNITTWADGSRNNSFDIDPLSAGNDITVIATPNNGAPFQNMINAPNQATPAVTSNFQGGLASIDKTLSIALDLTSNTQTVTVTINFAALYAAGVSNVSFTIFDVDFSNSGGNTYQDQLTLIRALSIDGTTLIAPTITTSASNTLTGTGLNQVVNGTASVADTGAASGNGNVTISFGTAAIKSLTFTYGSSSLFANPTYQHIGIHNINFTPVPELNPAWSALLSCLAATGLVLRHRSHFRK